MCSGVKRKPLKKEFAMRWIKKWFISNRWPLVIWYSKKVRIMTGVWKMSPQWKKFHFSRRIAWNHNFTIYRPLPRCILRIQPSSVSDFSINVLTVKMKAGKISWNFSLSWKRTRDLIMIFQSSIWSHLQGRKSENKISPRSESLFSISTVIQQLYLQSTI